jgi:hypothetical protein
MPQRGFRDMTLVSWKAKTICIWGMLDYFRICFDFCTDIKIKLYMDSARCFGSESLLCG